MKISYSKLLIDLTISCAVGVDLLNGVMQVLASIDLSVGVMYRGLLLILLLPYMFIKNNFVNLYAKVLLASFVVSMVFWIFKGSSDYLVKEISVFIRIIYLYVLIAFLAHFKEKHKWLFIVKRIVFFGSVVGIALLFSFFTGVGIDTYGDYTFGVKSFFKAQNDLGVTLLICLVFAIYAYLTYRKFTFLIGSLLNTTGLFLLGTRTGMGGAILVWILFFCAIVMFKFRSTEIPVSFRRKLYVIVLLMIGGVGYLVVTIVMRYGYMLQRFNVDALTSNFTRAGLIDAGNEVIAKMRLSELLFGQGWELFHRNVGYELYNSFSVSRYVEVDIYDLFGAYGIFLGGALLLFPVIVFVFSLSNFIRSLSLVNFTVLVSICLYIGHSFYAGHVINSPTVSTVACVLIFKILDTRFNRYEK